MEVLLLVSLIVVILAGFATVVFLLRKQSQAAPEDNQSFLMIQNQINEVNRTLDSKLSESSLFIRNQVSESLKIVKDVTESLTKLDETNRQVVNFADQLQDLQDILKNPKQRGILGEYYLETVLKNVLPPGNFQMQYAFPDGVIVDAAVFVKDKVIPVDSKFSLENYNRLLETRDEKEKKRIEDALRGDLKIRIDETSKYIKPENGTMEFAFMFIPSEALYYDLLVNKVGAVEGRDLIQYAAGEKKVIIVSPTTFLAYLTTVLQGLRALQVEETAKDIIRRVGDLGRHIGVYENYMKKIGDHLGTTVNAYNTAYKELGKIDKDVMKISGEKNNIEPLILEKPINDE
ncbi:MAG: DNA recombination protein RmuC [bacterium]|nr:DNA recombination protein RmuC [bacterium]